MPALQFPVDKELFVIQLLHREEQALQQQVMRVFVFYEQFSADKEQKPHKHAARKTHNACLAQTRTGTAAVAAGADAGEEEKRLDPRTPAAEHVTAGPCQFTGRRGEGEQKAKDVHLIECVPVNDCFACP